MAGRRYAENKRKHAGHKRLDIWREQDERCFYCHALLMDIGAVADADILNHRSRERIGGDWLTYIDAEGVKQQRLIATLDHVRPVSEATYGDKWINERVNLVVACGPCNRKRQFQKQTAFSKCESCGILVHARMYCGWCQMRVFAELNGMLPDEWDGKQHLPKWTQRRMREYGMIL